MQRFGEVKRIRVKESKEIEMVELIERRVKGELKMRVVFACL